MWTLFLIIVVVGCVIWVFRAFFAVKDTVETIKGGIEYYEELREYDHLFSQLPEDEKSKVQKESVETSNEGIKYKIQLALNKRPTEMTLDEYRNLGIKLKQEIDWFRNRVPVESTRTSRDEKSQQS